MNKKSLNNGFMLTETLLVSIFVCGVLIFFYVQFSTLSKNFSYSFSYNTVEKLYALEDIRTYLLFDEIYYSDIKTQIDESGMVDLIKSESLVVSYPLYFNELIDKLDIKSILITKDFIPNVNIDEYSIKFQRFIKLIKGDKESSNYRILAEFNDNKFSTITINGDNYE